MSFSKGFNAGTARTSGKGRNRGNIAPIRPMVNDCVPENRVNDRGAMEFFLCVIGMVMFVEGFPYAAFPNRMKIWIQRILELPPAALRGFGLIMMLGGLMLVYFGKR